MNDECESANMVCFPGMTCVFNR